MESDGGHKYITGTMIIKGVKNKVHVFFDNTLEEKKLFENCEIVLEGELVASDSSSPHHLLQAKVMSIKMNCDLPLENLTIKDRLMATGLIHEFSTCFRRDKIRAREILKVLSVSESYAEEILLRNSYILPFV